MIRHIVMWKFREGEEEKSQEFLTGLSALNGVIPQIRAMEIDRSCNPKNEYDAVLSVTFDSMEDMETYKNDPRHVAVSSLCKSIRTARASIDVTC